MAMRNEQQDEVEGYGFMPLPLGGMPVFKLPPPPPPPPPSGTVSVTEGYGGGSYSGSSDPGGLDFGDAPVIRVF